MHTTNRGKPLIYLDSSATSQKPKQVIEALQRYYNQENANIHRGVYELSERATKIIRTIPIRNKKLYECETGT